MGDDLEKLNTLGETFYISSANAKLDAAVKRLLAEKPILEWILSYAVEEFRGMKPDEIAPYIGDIAVAKFPVMPGATDSAVIDKLSEESGIPHEGLVTYDIRFYARSPKGGKTPAEYRLIMNIEAQKVQKPGYDLTTRGIIYCARQISEQLGRNIRHGNYQDVEKVYSIWIVMDCSQKSANTISEARWTYRDLVGHYDYEPRIDIERVIIIRLPKDNEWDKAMNRPEPIHEMLSTLLSNEIHPNEKLKTLNEDFKIPVTENFREEVGHMCNFSEAILNQGLEKGREEGIEKGREEGISVGKKDEKDNTARRMIRMDKFTDEVIAEATGLAPERIKELRAEEEGSSVQA